MRPAKPEELVTGSDYGSTVIAIQSQINSFLESNLPPDAKVINTQDNTEIQVKDFALRQLTFHYLLHGLKQCFLSLFKEFCQIYELADVRAFANSLTSRRRIPDNRAPVHDPIWMYLRPLKEGEHKALERFIRKISGRISKLGLERMFQIKLTRYTEIEYNGSMRPQEADSGDQYAILVTFLIINGEDTEIYNFLPPLAPSDPGIPEQHAISLEDLTSRSVEELGSYRSEYFYERFVFYVEDIRKIGRCFFKYLKETNK